MEQVDIALQYAKKGVKVFPCCHETKAPLIRRGFKSGTTDEKKIRGWWEKHPDAFIASSCESLCIVDVDRYALPEDVDQLVGEVLDALKSKKVISDDTMRVRTKNGGTHYYFKSTETARFINKLPSIDILGEGGYAILADQKTYICETHDKPWESIDSIKRLNEVELAKVQHIYEDSAKESKLKVKEYRESIGFKKKRRPALATKAPLKTAIIPSDKRRKPVNPAVFHDSKDDPAVEGGVYASEEEKDFNRMDGTEKLLGENGKLVLSYGDVDTDVINALFHNREIQKIMANYLNVNVPALNKGTVQRSVLPGHIDRNPSLGVRWNKDKTHIICRDFSNFYCDKYNQIDYNLVRLYATIKYGRNVGKLSKNEFVTWFFRLLHDCGLIDLPKEKKKNTKGLPDSEACLYNAFVLLDQLKRLYKGYEGKSAMAKNFGCAWSGISSPIFNRCINELVRKQFLMDAGVHQGRGGMRPMRLYSVAEITTKQTTPIEKDNTDMKLKEAIDQSLMIQCGEHRARFYVEENAKFRAKMKEQDEAEGVNTVVWLKASNEFHEKLTNFLEDYGVDDVVSRDALVVPIIMRSKNIKIKEDRTVMNNSYYVPADSLMVTRDDGDLGMHPLAICFESKEIENLRSFYEQQYGNDMKAIDDMHDLFEMKLAYDTPEMPELDLLNLKFAIRDYFDYIPFESQVITHITDDDLVRLMNGHDPEEELEME